MKWWDESWNFVTGCTPVSEACENCYAAREAATRLAHLPQYAGLAVESGDTYRFTGEVRVNSGLVEQPFHWRKPRTVFVCNTSDLFHKSVPSAVIRRAFKVMEYTQSHVYLILTKRPSRMAHEVAGYLTAAQLHSMPRNIWLGTTVENMSVLNRTIYLASIRSANKFISVEPMLGPISFPPSVLQCVKCVIAGGESGPNARPSHPDHFRWLLEDCKSAGTRFVFKQWGEWAPDENDNMVRVGRKNAGNVLDGVKYEVVPWPIG